MTFRNVLNNIKHTNTERLKVKARCANALAKTTTEPAVRRALYGVKSLAVTRLVELGSASVGEMLFESDMVVGLWFQGGGGLHVLFRDLSPRAQQIVLTQVNSAAQNGISFSKSLPHPKQSKENPNEQYC